LKPAEIDPICLQDEDNLTIKQRLDCEAQLLEYQLNAIVELNNYYSRINTEKICEDFTKTEYIIGDTISAEILERNGKLLDDNARLKLKVETLTEDVNTCIAKRDSERNIFNKTINDKNNEIEEIKIDTEQDILKTRELEKAKREELRDSLLNKIKFLISCGIFVCIALAGYKLFMQTRFLDEVRWINYWLLLGVGLLLLFVRFGLWIWG
jgi:hypothetical protein